MAVKDRLIVRAVRSFIEARFHNFLAVSELRYRRVSLLLLLLLLLSLLLLLLLSLVLLLLLLLAVSPGAVALRSSSQFVSVVSAVAVAVAVVVDECSASTFAVDIRTPTGTVPRMTRARNESISRGNNKSRQESHRGWGTQNCKEDMINPLSHAHMCFVALCCSSFCRAREEKKQAQRQAISSYRQARSPTIRTGGRSESTVFSCFVCSAMKWAVFI